MLKKLFSLFAALTLSVGLWATPASVPTVTDVTAAGYDETKRVIVLYFDEEVCNDIVWAGSYNGGSTTPAEMLHFVALEGFEGWYVVEVEDASNPCQGKPVQLKKDGSFDWQYQSGDVDAWFNMDQPGTKTATIDAGLPGEAYCEWPSTGVYIYEVAYFKMHNSPCSIETPKHNYTISAYLPEFCDAIAAYADSARVMGGFDGWTDGIWMQKMVDEDFKDIWYAKIYDVEEGTEFKLRFGTDADWKVQVQLNGQNLGNEKTGETTDIVLQYDGEGYDFAACAAPKADVYMSGDILIIDEVYDIETGNLVGWNYTMHEPSVNNIMLRTNSTDKYGTFSFEDKTLTDEIYNITRITEEGYKQQSFISGSMTIDEVGDSIVLDGLFLCEDGKKYALHFTHLKAALNEDTNMDFDADFEYYQMSSYLDGGVISIEAYSNSGMVHLELYADPAATTIPAGVYVISDTQEAMTAMKSSGVVDEEHTGCYAATLNTYTGDLHDLWFMLGGTITIDYDENGRLTVAVETTNSYGRQAHINVAYKPITPIATEEINNTSLFITNDAQRANVYDYMIYDEYGYLLAALMVKTDTLCGNFENAVDLPQCAIKVPGAIVPYYLIDAKPFTVSGEGKELSINVSVLAADTILYVITGTGYIGAIYPDTKDNYNGQYTTEELKMKQVEDGLVELTATNADNDDMTIVIWATLEEDGTLAKGEYNEIMASEGITEENTVAPSAVVDANDNVWLIQSGKLTVAADGSMVFEGLNSYDKEVKITISPATGLQEILAQPTATKFFDGQRVFIRRANKTFDMVGRELR